MRIASFALVLALALFLTSYGYAAVSDVNAWWNESNSYEELFYESGTDGNLTSWSGDTGDFTDDQNFFKRTAGGVKELYKDFSDITAVDFNFFVRFQDTGNNILFFSDSTSASTENSRYRLRTSATLAQLETMVEGTSTTLISMPFNFTSGIFYDFNITRDANGFFRLWIDDNFQETTEWADTNFTSGDYIVLHSTGGGFDDVSMYRPPKLTVKPPIDEDTGTMLDTNTYSFTVKIWDQNTLTITADLNQETDFDISINTGLYTKLEIDTNVSADYYPRQYNLDFEGSYTLQPYLPPIAESGNFIFTVRDSTNLEPIKDVRIVLETSVPDEGMTEVQQILTDETGQATIPMVLDNPYLAHYYYGGVLQKTEDLTPTAGSLFYQVLLDITVGVITDLNIGRLVVDFNVDTAYIIQSPNGMADMNITISLTGKDIDTITIYFRDTNGTDYNVTNLTSPWTDGNSMYLDVNIDSFGAFDSRYAIYIVVDVNSTDGNSYSITSIHYRVIQTEDYDLWYRLGLVASDLNPDGSLLVTSFLAIFLTLLAVGTLAAGTGIHDPAMLGIIALGMMGLFLFIGWIALMPFMFITIATLMTMFLTKAVMG